MADLITTEQAAQLAGITPSTWRYYLSRRRSLGRGEIPLPAEYHGRTAMYERAAVVAWTHNRPGRGARSDLRALERADVRTTQPPADQ